MTSAATALEPMRKRGRPKGSGSFRTKTAKFDIGVAMDALADIACQPPQGRPWNWDGSAYPLQKRTDAPDIGALNDHSPVIFVLIRLAPNGYPDAYRLRDLLMRMATVFSIFPEDRSYEATLSLKTRAVMAADRWRVMCKHCLMLVKTNFEVPEGFEGLKDVLAAIHLPESEPRAGTGPATDSLPTFDDTTPQCSMLRTENQQPDETPFSCMRMSQEIPHHEDGLIDCPRVAYHVPYSDEGIIDWSQVEDDLPAPESNESDEDSEVKAAKLDFSKAQPSNLHSYYHHQDDVDCVVVGHICNCPLCQKVEDLSSPAGKRSEASAATAFIADKLMTVADYPQLIAAPAADTQTVDSF